MVKIMAKKVEEVVKVVEEVEGVLEEVEIVEAGRTLVEMEVELAMY